MSRSFRKTSITGITIADSEKQDKRDYNRRYRRVIKQKLPVHQDDKGLPHLKEYSDPWVMDKDGKQYFNKTEAPHLMRK